ncbi:DUF736 domain-containing protein [Sphingomonas cannabina]|uniref:DUF736 domain-containing protein n=1 Tax=Sphingomonas cannabina TaxID=2899123 RepID=UPI001F353A36|nr:DUF736 domain-containing protein [Sphingomonas cannabina]UIJ44777.1 DUF736 domain-containing protein [Sphingomonas cannabina]
MPALGTVTRTADGFKGVFKTPTMSRPVRIEIVPNAEKRTEAQPDYRVYLGDAEVGGGWNRIGEASGKPYTSLSIAAPEFGPRRIYANLGRAAGQDDEDVLAVIWNPLD